ncbi:nuclear transport factor 2 family protein [uncultured Brevundimonas sp.]|uniref:nuclear transport factor 2 family protein n=1 Tax=uncultured Brevundimonas sp. TaxID=213418 RepID=UPI0030EBA2FC|tara:strand:+ start:1291 stop:1821 length:531 start_codon:yes stop_codon:yes gene_type:complete
MTFRQISIAALTAAGLVWLPMTATAEAPAVIVNASALSAVTTTEADNKAVVESLYRAFAAGDGPTIGGILSPDIVWVEAENGPYADLNPYNGPAAVFEGVFGRIGQQWQGFVVTPVTILASGDRVVSLGRYTGTNTATGEALDAQFVHVFTLAGGKIVGFQQYTDTAQWMDKVTPD